MRHTVYILGSAQDAGLPQFGSRAPADVAARLDPLAARLGPSLAVLSEDGRCLIIDVSPDIKAQEERLPVPEVSELSPLELRTALLALRELLEP